ncbi:hypothetical protein LZ023_31045 [Pseudomonas silvicola]|nr:hypothetical protein LZ023_31045 [Pseudomonas silvicola]
MFDAQCQEALACTADAGRLLQVLGSAELSQKNRDSANGKEKPKAIQLPADRPWRASEGSLCVPLEKGTYELGAVSAVQ